MNTVVLGKDRYHLQDQMTNWCSTYIGPGRWSYADPKTWKGLEPNLWIINSAFGTTRISFKEEKHLTLFMLRWL